MKIAIIGTGISGLTCGYYLHKQHDITLYEANDYIGGHTATIDVELDGIAYQVDTGFIVYNDRTYPRFNRLLKQIGVEGNPTQMSFSVRNDATGLEYNGHTASTLFAQKSNWLRLSFYRFVFDILRFNRLAKQEVELDSVSEEETLGDFLTRHRFNKLFIENYILPMGAAIWSSTLADMRAFPLSFFLRFFLNHGLLDVTNRPQWYVIKGGSKAYIPPLIKGFNHRIRLNSPVQQVLRLNGQVFVSSDGKTETYDHVIFACHSDQALKMLAEPSDKERLILGDLTYQANEVILHTDSSLLPKAPKAWASWNYWLDGSKTQQGLPPSLTYNMNILQHIESEHTFCVTLNSRERIDETKILRSFTYHHPVFSKQAIGAQKRKLEIQGKSGVWFCGAYWYNGFHEDGVHSALDVVEAMENSAYERHLGAA